MMRTRPVSRGYRKQKLHKLLGRTRLRQFLILIWAVDQIRRGERRFAKAHLQFPNEALGANPENQYYIAPWMLETLINEILVCVPPKRNARRLVDCSSWSSFATLYNHLNELEDAESLSDVPKGEILNSLARIGWRQFDWQAGFKSSAKFYRAWSLYCFPDADRFFFDRYGLTVERFCFIGFVISAALEAHPAVRTDVSLSNIGINNAERDAFFRLVSLSSQNLRRTARAKRQGKSQTAYKPSVLRETPMISLPNGEFQEAFCPIPQLLYNRYSEGLFYDLIGDDDLRRQISERFEKYALEITQHYMSREYGLLAETAYGPKGRSRKTPDLRLISRETVLRAVIECKSRRLPFNIVSSPNPVAENQEFYSELAKGVVQVWKYVSDVRNGVADKSWRLSDDLVGVVLTLAPSLQLTDGLVQAILNEAKYKCEQLAEIKTCDQVPIAFVAMADWEVCLGKIDAHGFLEALARHSEPDRSGYLLRHSVDEVVEKGTYSSDIAIFEYHSSLSRVVGWWGDLETGKTPSST